MVAIVTGFNFQDYSSSVFSTLLLLFPPHFSIFDLNFTFGIGGYSITDARYNCILQHNGVRIFFVFFLKLLPRIFPSFT
uniref:Uncharacterized protein n=1 Tax=Rhizophora mucronata TaxID=61149 RepID=A0A2P2PP08_RHIMU